MTEPSQSHRRLLTGSAIASPIVALALAFLKSSSVSDKIDAHARELAGKLDEQSKTITTLQLTLVEIKAQGAARDAAFERLAAGLADAVKELRELERARATDSEQLREHDRRLGAIEGRK